MDCGVDEADFAAVPLGQKIGKQRSGGPCTHDRNIEFCFAAFMWEAFKRLLNSVKLTSPPHAKGSMTTTMTMMPTKLTGAKSGSRG
mmetsp:Transcript_11595/g.25508  ORF Transcript_11595/g.25508 Transcript_11595/m.25508 type:complete len:86 (-) Transcript_11595:262-519(-)